MLTWLKNERLVLWKWRRLAWIVRRVLPESSLLPFGDDVVVGLHFEQAFENERKALGGRLFQRQDLDVVVVHAQMAAMAFEVRFAEVVVEKRVVLEFGEFELVGVEVEGLLQDAERFLFVENANGEKIADLEDEALRLLKECGLGLGDFASQDERLAFSRRSGRPARRAPSLGCFGNVRERVLASECEVCGSLMENHVVDGEGEKRVGLAAEIGDAVLDRRVDDGVAVEFVRDGLVVSLEEILVDAIVVAKELSARTRGASSMPSIAAPSRHS